MLLQIRPEDRDPPDAPIELKEFTRQAFEPDHRVGRGALDRLPDVPDARVECAPRSGIRRIALAPIPTSAGPVSRA
jgi:hypothetical protein